DADVGTGAEMLQRNAAPNEEEARADASLDTGTQCIAASSPSALGSVDECGVEQHKDQKPDSFAPGHSAGGELCGSQHQQPQHPTQQCIEVATERASTILHQPAPFPSAATCPLSPTGS